MQKTVEMSYSARNKEHPRMGCFFISVGVAVWTKRLQSEIAGFGASVDENELFAKFESYAAKGAH